MNFRSFKQRRLHRNPGIGADQRRGPAARCMAGVLAVSLALLPLPGTAQFSAGSSGGGNNLPSIGEESESVLSPRMERRIGEEYYRELRGSPDYLDDPEIAAYVAELGARLIAASPEPGLDVEFFVMKDDSINAFAMLGGFIGVNTGLLIAAQSESEAASVLGHELGHLIQKHIARSVSAGQKISMASMVAAALCLLAARSNSQATQACMMGVTAVPISQQLAYSRDFEREADRIGFEILRKGGFDVTAMPAFFERLQRANRVYDSNVPVYVRSHPLTTERIADVRNRAQFAPYRQHADSLGFHLARAKLRANMDSTVDGMRDAQRYFSSQIADKSYANLAAAHYGYAVALLRARDYARAQAELAQIPKSVVHPMIDSLGAEILLARQDYAGAVTAFRAAAAKFSGVRYLQLHLIRALQLANRHEEALVLLRDQTQNYRSDPAVFELQARSYAAVNKRMLQHRSMAEFHALLGRYQPAINELMMARCTGEGDFYQYSIIDARIRTLWDDMAEQKRDREGKSSGDDGGRKRLPPMAERPPEGRC
jgi:predicted Zn-dependent protease